MAQRMVRLPGVTTVGESGASQTVTVLLAQGGTVDRVKVVTQGAEGLDFQSKGDTCRSSAAFLPGQSCTVDIGFSPKSAGERRGAVILLDKRQQPLATQPFAATASGPIATFVPGVISTVAGNTNRFIFSGDGGPATSASIFLPFGVALDGAGDIYIADTYNGRIREVNATTKVINTVAGNGSVGYTGDGGLATSASLNYPSSVELDSAGNIYIADTGNNVIRKVDISTGTISTVAGNGTGGYSGNGGAATSASLKSPNGMDFDAAGNLYIADTGNNVVRMVNAFTGTISTVAGNNVAGYSGNGGPATSASLRGPWGVTVLSAGGFYIADQTNNAVRKVDALGVITTIAGNGIAGFTGDGNAASNAELNNPATIVLDAAGNIYIADSGNNRIRKINAGTNTIATIAGGAGGADGNPATGVSLYGPYTMALDGDGDLFIADTFHNRIREVSSNTAILDYPALRLGSNSAVMDQALENDGNATLNLSSIAVVSNAQIDSSTTCSTSAPLAPLAQCTLAAIFAPTAIGAPATGSIAIDSNARNANNTLNLQGTVQSTFDATVLLNSSPNPSIVGNPVLFSIQVVSSGGIVPTGTITLLDGNTKITPTPLTLMNGIASVSISNLTVGMHTITAMYSGDQNDGSSVSAPLIQTVGVLPPDSGTSTALTSNLNPIGAGLPLMLTATVAANTAGQAVPGGTVSFQEGAIVLGTGILAAGTTSITISTLTPGTHSIVAVYSGNSSYATSTSLALPQVVIAVGTSTDFSFKVTPTTLTLKSGDNTTLQITLTTTGTFAADTLSFGCGGLPPDTTCTFSQDQFAATSNMTKTLSVVLDTGNPLRSGASAHLDRPNIGGKTGVLACMLPAGAFLMLLLGGSGRRLNHRLRHLDKLLFAIVVGGFVALTGCGSGFTATSTPAGTYNLQVFANASASETTYVVPIQLTVTK